MVMFGDTFFDVDFNNITTMSDDAVVWTSQVKNKSDITQLGMVIVEDNYATKLIEKPDEPISDLAMIGLYYVKDSAVLFDAIKYLFDNSIKTKSSYHLTDALQYLIDKEYKIAVRVAHRWIDGDHGDGIFRLNKKLLGSAGRNSGKTFNSVVIKPSYIGKGAIINDSVIGPYASIGVGSLIEGCVIRDSIVCTGVELRDVALEQSVIATGGRIKGKRKRFMLDPNARLNVD